MSQPDITQFHSCQSRAESELVFDLRELDGHDFEEAMEKVFQRKGYRTKRGKLSNDEGRDIELYKDDKLVFVVECKHQQSSVGRPVIQKLDSATRDAHADNGLVVTTSSFSPGAAEYAQRHNVTIWDYQRLIEEARTVGVYFVKTTLFFQVPWRTKSEFELLLRHQYLDRIKSNPRKAPDVFRIGEIRHEVVPALFLAYTVDKQFQTQTGLVYHAKDSGRMIYPAAGNEIGPQEQTFWRDSNPARLYAQEIEGKALPKYFGEPTADLVETTKTELARKFSRKVRYQGRNNQSYEKFCEVSSNDVQVQIKQVLYGRWNVHFQVGPRTYAACLADDAARQPGVGQTSGFVAGSEGFVSGDGFLCNDCGLIVPNAGEQAGLTCEGCGMTLCRSHSWKWPAPLLEHSPRLCSACYTSRNPKTGAPDTASLCAGVLLLLSFGLACFFRQTEGIVAVVLGSILLSLYWGWRVSCHNTNMVSLAKYEPEWKE